MLDMPQEPAIVHECVVKCEAKIAVQKELEIMDLSFYDTLLGGMCSGSSSSGPAKQETASIVSDKRDS